MKREGYGDRDGLTCCRRRGEKRAEKRGQMPASTAKSGDELDHGEWKVGKGTVVVARVSRGRPPALAADAHHDLYELWLEKGRRGCCSRGERANVRPSS